MFRNLIAPNNDENGTENWSYPAGFERFNSANIPRSRLGRRRTINPTPEVKRSILNEGKCDKKDEFKDFGSKTSSLTHPVNSFLTPNYKKIENSSEQNCSQGNENRISDLNTGPLTPFRSVGSYPLQEVNNFQCFLNDHNRGLQTGKSQNVGLEIEQQDQSQTEVKKVLNKSFECERNSSGDYTQLHSFSSNNGAAHSDTSHSDLGNNSSFITAHDIYNGERNRNHHDFLKTPGKGYGLFDMVASPLDSLSTHTDDDTVSLRNFLVKTPGLCRYDPLHTPYRSQIRHDFYTPFKNKTPAQYKHLEGVPERETESEELQKHQQDSKPIIEESVRKERSVFSGESFPSKSNEKVALGGLAPVADNICIEKETSNEVKNPTHSVEKIVKRQIFEGLGWTLPHTSFAVQSPLKETSSTLFKKNDSYHVPENSKLQMILDEAEPETRTKSDTSMFHESLFKSDTELELLSKSSENPHNKVLEESGSLTSSKKTSVSLVDDSSRRSSNLSAEPKKHDLPIHDEITYLNALSSHSISPPATVKVVSDEKDINIQTSKSPAYNSTKKTSLSQEKDSTVVMRPPESKQEVISKSSECNNDTVILKQQAQQNSIMQKPAVEVQNDANKNVQECFINPAPLLGCPRQIIGPPQSNIIFVNKKPYTVLSMLGRGGSSEVYQVLEGNSSKLMALKFVNLSSVEDTVAKGYLNEIEVLSKLQGCPSVIKMFDNEYIPENKILYVLMEKGDTDFSRLMKDITKTKKISMPMIIYYWTEMLNAVKDIHDKGIIHSDLKPANFLLVSGRLKLIDFGIASSLQGDMTSVLKDVTTGTFNYMSPEAIRNSGETRGYKINYKSDIWSLGCILYNLIYGRTPFSHLTNTWTKLQAIADPETAVSFPAGSAAPPHLLLSVRWALTKDPKERPTAEELLRLADLTPGPETQLGRQISSLLGEYIYQMFPNCRIRFESPKDKKPTNNFHR